MSAPDCDICGFPHWPYQTLQRWVNEHGRFPQPGSDRMTMRMKQTQRYVKIMENHREGKQKWTPMEIFNPRKAEKEMGREKSSRKNSTKRMMPAASTQ